MLIYDLKYENQSNQISILKKLNSIKFGEYIKQKKSLRVSDFSFI